jgi:hypothetical protein
MSTATSAGVSSGRPSSYLAKYGRAASTRFIVIAMVK